MYLYLGWYFPQFAHVKVVLSALRLTLPLFREPILFQQYTVFLRRGPAFIFGLLRTRPASPDSHPPRLH